MGNGDVSDETVRRLPTVSVIIPTVDRPQMLQRAIGAVASQDYPGEVEIVVVFDHVEPSLTDAELSPTRRLRVTTNSRTKGLAGNRNSGYLAATGELVCPCDDDDEWLQGKLVAQVDLLMAHPEAAAVGTGCFISSDGKDVPRTAPTRPLLFDDFLRSRNMEVNSSTMLMRRADVVGRIGLIDEQLPGSYAEDYEWLLRASRCGPVICDPRPFVRVNWHESSFFTARWQTMISSLTYLLERVPEFADHPVGLARIEGQIAFAHAAMGERRQAMRWGGRALTKSRRSRQAWAALAVSSGLAPVSLILSLGRRYGHGI